jgi:hypothetical protein
MRKLIADTTKNTPAIQAIVARRIYAASSLGKGNVPADPKKPFVVYREVDRIAANVAKDTAPGVCRRVFQFYVHDERGSYSRIDRVLELLVQTVVGLTTQRSSSGAVCMEAVWNGTSGDSEDPTYDSNMKFATFTLVSSN